MKHEKIMTGFAALGPKKYRYLTDEGHEKRKRCKKRVIKRKLKFEDYKESIFFRSNAT